MSELKRLVSDLPTYLNLVDADDEHFVLKAHEMATPGFIELRRKSDLVPLFRVELDESMVFGAACVGEHTLIATRSTVRAYDRKGGEVARATTSQFFEALCPLDDTRVVTCIANVPHTLDIKSFLRGAPEWTAHERKSGPLSSVHASPDGRFYTTGELDMTRVYDVEKGKQVRCIRKAGAPTLFLHASRFVTGGHRDLYFHDVGKKWPQVAHFQLPNRLRALAVTPNGERLAAAASGYKASSHLLHYDLSHMDAPTVLGTSLLPSDADEGLLFLDNERLLIAQKNALYLAPSPVR